MFWGLTVGTWQPLAHLHDGGTRLVPAGIACRLLRAIPHALQDSVLDALRLAGGHTLHMHRHTQLLISCTLMEVDSHVQFPFSFKYAQ